MVPVVSRHAMQKIDQLATSRYGIPPLLLMEHAGRCVVDECEKRFGPLKDKKVLIVAGKGNNGGDGFVAARYLLKRKAFVSVLLIGKENELTEDSQANYDILKNVENTRLRMLFNFNDREFERSGYDFVFDGIFGTSFHGDVKGPAKKLIDWMNLQHRPKIVAIDLPSGLEADTGYAGVTAVKAQLTVTMALPKIGFYFQKGPLHTGEIRIADIHIPKQLAKTSRSKIFLSEEEDITGKLPVRRKDAHKYSVGKTLVLAGSKGLSGAALLSSQSAMKSGAGAVVLGVPSAIFPAISRRTLEVMPLDLPSTSEGSLALSAMASIRKKVDWSDVVLIGPGLSRNGETQNVIRSLVQSVTKPLIIDADGLNAIAANISCLKKRKSRNVVLTPHLGEFSALISKGAREIEMNKVEIARAFARKYRVVLVLKGAPTIVAAPDGGVFINPNGNAGMATAGSGDVLGGIIAALVGQGNSAIDAAINGVFVHGTAGDLARDEIGEMGMLASDILARIPRVLKALCKRREGMHG